MAATSDWKTGAAHGHVWADRCLDAHAQLEVRIGHTPVDESSLELHDGCVSPQGHTALGIVGSAPDGLADFKVDLTGKVFVSHGVDDQADTGPGLEFVFARVIAGMPAIGEVAVLAILETRQPYSLGLEVYSMGLPGRLLSPWPPPAAGTRSFHNPSSRETVIAGQSPEIWVQKQTRRPNRSLRGWCNLKKGGSCDPPLFIMLDLHKQGNVKPMALQGQLVGSWRSASTLRHASFRDVPLPGKDASPAHSRGSLDAGTTGLAVAAVEAAAASFWACSMVRPRLRIRQKPWYRHFRLPFGRNALILGDAVDVGVLHHIGSGIAALSQSSIVFSSFRA